MTKCHQTDVMESYDYLTCHQTAVMQHAVPHVHAPIDGKVIVGNCRRLIMMADSSSEDAVALFALFHHAGARTKE